jgi:hypothetical protein
MKVTKIFLAIFASLVMGFGVAFYASSGAAGEAFCERGATAAAKCGKCGDGYCNPRCGETAQSCPRDCGGVPQTR